MIQAFVYIIQMVFGSKLVEMNIVYYQIQQTFDLYQYEIWKKDGNNLTFVNNVHVSLDKFRKYYFADERSTNYKIIEELIIPTIIKENSEKKYTITQVDKSTD